MATSSDQRATKSSQELSSLREQVTSLSLQLALLRAGDEPGVWPCGCQVRVDALGVPTPLENDARCDDHLGMASQLAGMRNATEAFLAKWALVLPEIDGVFGLQQMRSGVTYKGPTINVKIDALRASLSAAQAPTPQETME